MNQSAALDQIASLLLADQTQTVNTSMRIPVNLRNAAMIATDELNLAPSTTTLTVDGLRQQLRALLIRGALDEHYTNYPDSRPSLTELAQAEADLTNHRLRDQPDVIAQAAQDIVSVQQHPSPTDVLVWADAQSFFQTRS
jgi:hypothetical protein